MAVAKLLIEKGADVMNKKIVEFMVIMLISISLCGCGAKKSNPFVGEWKYDTGLAEWDVIFEEEENARFTSGTHWTIGTYEINEENKTVNLKYDSDREWIFRYEKKGNSVELIGPLPYEWIFKKNDDYDAVNEKQEFESYEMMSDDVYKEVNTLIDKGDTEEYVLGCLKVQYPDFDFINFEITSQERVGYYSYYVYGKVYSQDKFKENYTDKVSVMYRAEKNAEGYEIKRYLYKYNENGQIIP